MVGVIEIIATVIAYYIIIAYFVFILICEKYNLFVSFRMLPNQTISEYKEEWENFTTLEKTDFILAVFFTMLLLINLCLGFIDKYHSLFIVFCFIVYLIARSIFLHPSDILPPKEQIKELLSERWDRWKSRSGLKKTYFVLASVVVSIFFYSFWFIFPEFLDKIDDKDTSFYNLSLAVFAILSGFGAVFGFYTSIIKTETVEQGQITERLNKAIENLGKSTEGDDPVIEVRIGALFALERIAQDSIRDHIQIVEIICAYIRHNSPLPNDTDKTNVPHRVIPAIKAKRRKNKNEVIDEDIQTALTIIGRRDKWPEGKKRLKKESDHKCEINLFECNLCGAKFSYGNLDGAELIGSDMTRAWFDGTSLIDASLANADLTGAWFEDAVLKDTEFRNATTTAAHAKNGDFSNCLNLNQEKLNEMFLGKDIEVPENRTHPQEGTDYYETYNTFGDFMHACNQWIRETGIQP